MIREFKKQKIDFTIIPDMFSGIDTGHRSMLWDDLVILMTDSKGLNRKEEADQIIPVKWKPEDQWVKTDTLFEEDKDKKTFRNQNNVHEVTIAFLDLDEDGSLDQATEKFKEFDYAVHTTFSGKHRMAIRLDKPIPAQKWELAWTHLMSGINGDLSCKNLSRGYLMPSHNIGNNAKPESFVNKGKALTMSDIMELGVQYMDDRTKSSLEKIADKSENRSKGGTARHFSKVEANFSSYRKDDLSYEAFSRRRKNVIDECISEPITRGAKKGSRHSFALRVIGAEVMRFGENVDLSKTIQFIFRATKEHDKVLLSKGNTPKEIPEIISTALASSNIDRKVLSSNSFLQRIRNDIQHGLDISFKAEQTGNWNFVDFTQEKGAYSTTPKSVLSRYSLYIDRYKEAMHKQSGSADDLSQLAMKLFNGHIVNPVIQEELKNNTNADFTTIGRFLLHAMKSLRITRNIEERQNAYGEISDMLSKGLAKSNLEDSVIGRKVDVNDINQQFNKAYVLELASEAGFKSLKNIREKDKVKKQDPKTDDVGYP